MGLGYVLYTHRGESLARLWCVERYSEGAPPGEKVV